MLYQTKQLRKLGWTTFIKQLQHPSDINPAIRHIPHPAAAYLHRLARSGTPAPSTTPPWTRRRLKEVYQRGAHSSAMHQFRAFLFEDMWDMICKRYWVVLPFSEVQHFPSLKLAPAGIVPQRTRRPRPIMDYTFTAVNQGSLNIAPMQAMQFGTTIHRILQCIAYARSIHGPVLMSKIDLSDGYYHVPLSPSAALELAVVLPPLTGTKPIIGIPLVLPMGWKYSPLFFCAYTETIADVSNQVIGSQTPTSPHRLEMLIDTIAAPRDELHPSAIIPPQCYTLPDPIAYTDVYMDDFLGLAQPACSKTTLRATLHSIDSVFQPDTLPGDAPTRKAVISQSKLDAGDGRWSTRKVVLGWLLNTADKTIRLPQHKTDRLHELLQHFIPLRRTSRRKWQQLLGELRHLAVAIPGARYLFSILQSVLVEQPNSQRLRLNSLVTASLHDWEALATTLSTTPTPIQSLVPNPPAFLGAVDASRDGIGGAWLPTPQSPPTARPIIFHLPFPQHIKNRLVSASNPSGTITNSDMELAALITGAAILRDIYPGPHTAVYCASDNSAAVTWLKKGSTSSTAARAFLLRWLSTLTRTSRVDITPVFASGSTNTLADACSRNFHLSDQDFTALIQRQFPIRGGWHCAQPPNEIVSRMTLALSGEMWSLDCPSHDRTQQTTLGSCGKTFANPLQLTLQDPTCPTLFQFYRSLPSATGPEKYLPANLRCVAAQWGMPFAPWVRRWPSWDSTIPG